MSFYPSSNPLPTLDLHGYRKEAAIRAVTEFLDRQSRRNAPNDGWVTIITGAGSHSPDGPVLRTAVESLLRRRQIQFERDTPGSFKVQSRSGEVWYTEHQATDTKLVLADPRDFVPCLHRTQQPQSALSQTLVSSADGIGTISNQAALLSDFGPSVQEVARDDATIERIKEQSRLELQEEERYKTAMDKEAMAEALKASKELFKSQEEEFTKTLELTVEVSRHEQSKEQQKEEELMRRALKLSEREYELAQQKEERIFQLTKELSQREELKMLQKEEEMLKQALDVSRGDSPPTPQLLSDDELQSLTEKALQVSQRESSREFSEEELQCLTEQAISASLQETHNTCREYDEDDRLLEEVLRRSLQETVGPGS